MFTIKVHVIRNTAHRPSTQASYTIGSGTTMQENKLAAQIAAKHNNLSRMAPYMSWIFLVLVGIDPGVSRLGGEIVSHNTTDARQTTDARKQIYSFSFITWLLKYVEINNNKMVAAGNQIQNVHVSLLVIWFKRNKVLYLILWSERRSVSAVLKETLKSLYVYNVMCCLSEYASKLCLSDYISSHLGNLENVNYSLQYKIHHHIP